MSTLDRLARKTSTLSAADVEAAVQRGVEKALAGHATEAPATAPQSARVQALLRQAHIPMPALERRSAPAPAPAATAHKAEAAVAPRPPVWPVPAGEIPVVMRQNDLGRVMSFSMGDMEFQISRDGNGRILTASNEDGFGVRITRRDANGHVAGLSVTLPRGMR